MTTALAIYAAKEGTKLIDYITEFIGDDVYSPLIIINVDKPTSRIVSHIRDSYYVKKAQAKKWKGIGEMCRDGGWMLFREAEEARIWCEEHFPKYNITIAGAKKISMKISK